MVTLANLALYCKRKFWKFYNSEENMKKEEIKTAVRLGYAQVAKGGQLMLRASDVRLLRCECLPRRSAKASAIARRR